MRAAARQAFHAFEVAEFRLRRLFHDLRGGAARPDARLRDKRLIEWGWDEPDTAFLRRNASHMERFPFDGFVFHALDDRGRNLSRDTWSREPHAWDAFRGARADLAATRFFRLGDRFLRVNVTPGDVPLGGPGWATVCANFGVAARLAREAGCRGLLVDTEQYLGTVFAEDVAAAVARSAGQAWMAGIARWFPDVTLLVTFGYAMAQPRMAGGRLAATRYTRLADFLDGVLDVCPDAARLVDGWEWAYPYKRREEFAAAYQVIKEDALRWTAAPERYRRHVEAGFGIWMDYRSREDGWHARDPARNYFTPAALEAALHAALHVSDRYVWVYTEAPRWWTASRLPWAYVEAVERARHSR